MLAIRMQRTGRRGHAMFRVVVQDARRTPTSGKVVARLGSYDPHAKALVLDKERASFYLEHGAQPSDRVTRLLKSEGVKLPDWVKLPATDKQRTVRNADKRRSTRPAEPVAPAEPAAEETAAPAAEEAAVEPAEDTPPAEAPADETPAPEPEAPEAVPAEVAAEPAETAEAETTTPDETPAEDAKSE